MTRMSCAPLLALAAAVLLGSCGGDDDGPATPAPPAPPPRPVVADLPPRPFLGGPLPVAWAAEETVRAVLARIDTPAVLHDALAPASDLAWTAAGGCWEATDAATGWSYQACADGADWAWTVSSSSPAASGRTDGTGRQGAFADPDVAWTWLATASRDSVAWTWTRAATNVVWHWSRDGEGARLWLWTWPDARRIGYRVSAALTTGWCESYDWSSGGWVLRQEIAWTGGHGRWRRYDAAGAEIARDAW